MKTKEPINKMINLMIYNYYDFQREPTLDKIKFYEIHIYHMLYFRLQGNRAEGQAASGQSHILIQ